MATDLAGLIASITVEVQADIKLAADLHVPVSALRMLKSLVFAFGATLGKCDQVFWDRRVIAASGNDPLDLVGTLKNPLQGTVNFDFLKGIAIYNRSDEALTHAGGSHVITDAAIVVLDTSSTFTGPCKTIAKGQVIDAGGLFLAATPIVTGWAVTADSGDTFQVDNEDGADEALYDIVLLGVST